MRTLVALASTVILLALACGPAQAPGGTLTPVATPPGVADVPQTPAKRPGLTPGVADVPQPPLPRADLTPAPTDVPQPPLVKPKPATPAPGPTAGKAPEGVPGGPGPGLAFLAAYQGNVRIGGGPAPADLIGAKVEAVVDDRVCATSDILPPAQEGGMKVTPYSPLRVELGVDPQGQLVCGRPQATVQFLIAGSRLAVEQAPWGVGLHQVDLSWPGPLGAGGAKAAPTFQGRVVLLGGPVDDGMVVRAYVGPKLCGMATTTAGSFTLFLHTQESLGGCAKPGDGVRFIVGSQESRQSGVFQRVDQGTSLELTPQ